MVVNIMRLYRLSQHPRSKKMLRWKKFQQPNSNNNNSQLLLNSNQLLNNNNLQLNNNQVQKQLQEATWAQSKKYKWMS